MTASPTVDRILDTGLEFLQSRGLNGFSFRDISDRVGVKSASIHYHFPTKFDLALAILTRINAGFERALSDIDAGRGSASEKLEAFCDLFLDTYGDAGRLCPFCMVAVAQVSAPREVVDEARGFWRRGELWLTGVLEAGRASGELEFVTPAGEIARTYVSALEGALIIARAFEDRARIGEVGRFLKRDLAARTTAPDGRSS